LFIAYCSPNKFYDYEKDNDDFITGCILLVSICNSESSAGHYTQTSDTTKKHPMKSKMKKTKLSKDSTKKENLKPKIGDTTLKVPPVM
jgi:hypothetical protein